MKKILFISAITILFACKKKDATPKEEWSITVNITGQGTYTSQFGSVLSSGHLLTKTSTKTITGTCVAGDLFKVSLKPDSIMGNMSITEAITDNLYSGTTNEGCNGCVGLEKQY